MTYDLSSTKCFVLGGIKAPPPPLAGRRRFKKQDNLPVLFLSLRAAKKKCKRNTDKENKQVES